MPTFTVSSRATGERLDRFLTGAQPDLSRSRLQSLIRSGHVRVDGRATRASHRLREGERVELDVPPARAATLEAEAIPLAIVWEDEHLIVVDKPAGMVVHPGAGVKSGTLAHALLHHDPAIAAVGGAGRPGIVHRLDRDTSGLLVVARTERAWRALVEAMQARRVKRVYRALVWGDVRGENGTIDAPIARDPRHRQRMAVVTRGGRPARTHWSVMARWGLVTALEVTLDTGRTHQIRVHLSDRGHPVVGDPVYAGRSKKLLSLREPQRSLAGALLRVLPRQALHASELAFDHPVTGAPLRFQSRLPHDFDEALTWLERFRPTEPSKRTK
jgi:23S rRNA pseudouridine1911/1915/1917 synthase